MIISAGLDVDLNLSPKTNSESEKPLSDSVFGSAEKSTSVTSIREHQPASILGKRVRRSQSNVGESVKDQNKRRRNSENSRRYYQSLKDTRPEKLTEIAQRKRRRFSEMSPEEKQRMRESDARCYQKRKMERGFGGHYNEKLKEARRDIKSGTATREQIEIVLQNNRNKLRHYHLKKSKAISSRMSLPAKGDTGTS